MRISLKKRLFAVLLCCCAVFTSGCFPIHSILGNEYYDYAQSGSLDMKFAMMGDKNQAITGVYPEGQRAFKFNNCTYEADISDFKLIDVVGDVCLYYYTGITVLNDDEVGTNIDADSSSESSTYNLVNKKGYYDKTKAKLKYFWTIAGYNFENGNYFEVHSQEYYPASGDAGKMSGNPVTRYKDTYYSDYVINVGYFFIFFSVNSSYDHPNSFHLLSKETWKLSNDNKKTIRNSLGIKGSKNNFCCTDLAVKNRDEAKYAATFMILPTDDDFNQNNVMFEVELKSEVKDNKTVREIKLTEKEDEVLTVTGGNILSSNAVAGNCLYVLKENSIKNDKIKFGIDNRDRKTEFEIKIGFTTDENNVLQSFSVKDWVYKDDDGNKVVSDEESTLELVFKNRIEYYKIERYTSWFQTEYRAVDKKTYSLDKFCSTYLSSDDIPSIDTYSWGIDLPLDDIDSTGTYPSEINLSSTTSGFKCIDYSGETNWSFTSGAAFFSCAYGDKTLIIGFDGYTFDKTVRYFDNDGNEVGVSKSKSEFTLAQLPFATVRIV